MYREVPVTEIGHSKALGGAVWPWFDTTYTNLAALPPNLSLGQKWNLTGGTTDCGGQTFMIVRAYEALTQGQVVTFTGSTQGQVAGTVTSAGSSVSSIKTNITTVAGDQSVPLLLYIGNSTSSGGGPVLRHAKLTSNGAGTASYGTNSIFEIAPKDYMSPVTPNGPDALTLAATNGDVAILIRPYTVGVCTAATVPVGIALQTVTANYFTIIQTSGEGMALSLTTTPALVAMEPCKVAAGGTITGTGAAGTQPFIGGGVIIPHASFTGATPTLQAVAFNLNGNL